MKQLTKRSNETAAGLTLGMMTVRALTADDDSMSVEAVLATEQPVTVYDWSEGVIDEILIAGGGRFAETIPFLRCHKRESLEDVIGSVRDVRQEGSTWVGRIFFATEDENAIAAWSKVLEGHLTDVSIGYAATDFEDIRPGETRTIGTRTYTASDRTLRISHRWIAKEVSLVPIGADSAAKFRESADGYAGPRAPEVMIRKSPGIRTEEAACVGSLLMRCGIDPDPALTRLKVSDRDEAMNLAGQLSRGSLFSLCESALRLEGKDVPYSSPETVTRALHTRALPNILNATVGAILAAGWEDADDSTEGWTRLIDLVNFKLTDVPSLDVDADPTLLPSGGTAQEANLSDDKTQIKLHRFARRAELDERDILDDALDVLIDIPNYMGAGSRRLRPDWVYALLLQNPTLADGVALFHADHANLLTGGSSALDAASLQAAITKLSNQTDSLKRKLRPATKYLIVPNELEIAARTLLRNLESANDDPAKRIQLRVESRLGEAGTKHPITGVEYVGTTKNWILATAPGRTVEVGYRAGADRKPVIRSYELKNGRWGMGWDINFDITAKVIDYRGMVKSNGV